MLNKSVTQIGLYVDKIKYNHNVMLTSVLQSNEVKDETNDLMTQIKKISHEVHRRLKCEVAPPPPPPPPFMYCRQ